MDPGWAAPRHGVGDPVELPVEECLLVGRCQVAVVGDPDVVVVGHQVEQVLLEVGAGAADGVHLALPDHLGQGQAELGGGHGAGQGDQHAPVIVEELLVGAGGVDQGGGVEVAVVVADELFDTHGCKATETGRRWQGRWRCQCQCRWQ
jgi:hypothetical protein